jgi:hypothetical protein
LPAWHAEIIANACPWSGVAKRLRLVSLRLFDKRRGIGQVALVDVADGSGHHIGLPHEFPQPAGSLSTQADKPELDLVAGRGALSRRPPGVIRL